jgi:hypothetical protein
VIAATEVIGPVFIHGIASRTLEGLARVAEQSVRPQGTGQKPQAAVGAESRVTSHESL